MRLESLTALRFVAALPVFLFHINRKLEGTVLEPLARLLRPGLVGVSFFFILSGFVLAWSLRPADTYASHLRRRAARILPLHLAVFVLTLVVVAFQGRRIDPSATVASAGLLHAWIPGSAYARTPNPVTWSLSAEVFFYAVFPFLCAAVARLDHRQRKMLMAILVVIVIGWAGVQAGDPVSTLWSVYLFPGARVFEFMLGVLLAQGTWPRVPVPAALGGVAAGWWLALTAPAPYSYVAATIVPLTILVGSAAHGRRHLSEAGTAAMDGDASGRSPST